MQSFFDFVAVHWGVIALSGGMWLTAAFVTMPQERPRSFDDFYHWFYDTVHQFANLRNMRLPTMPAPSSTGPVDKKQQ